MSDPRPNEETLGLSGEANSAESDADRPKIIGRYRVDRVLGTGGFGRVYLAYDEELDRPVAIKVPHAHRVSNSTDVEEYLAEARAVAGLDHPGIVPVYDVGRTEDGLCYVVSKFIEGQSLAVIMRRQRPSYSESAELLADIADALHHSHLKGLVHRDIKPGNILIGPNGRPHVVDFGLALKDENFGKGAPLVGSPVYMSPEQARGEGHRVDGRADVFALGVVLYELLVGRRPFSGENNELLFEQITSIEPRPLRQVNDAIPKALERICLRALAKRVSDRYTTARDLSEELRRFLEETSENDSTAEVRKATSTPIENQATQTAHTPRASARDHAPSDREINVVPKGLRSFEPQDTDFFLDLLPGPRNWEGLPEGIRFWKDRIEETDRDETFAVGLLYGPSGCGKSSLVKAGLLPRLSDRVVVIYLESTGNDTERRLLQGLRRKCSQLSAELSLPESVADVRRGLGLGSDRKVLIVLDQFEQWLHTQRDQDRIELIEALRQCDGQRVQCVLIVRDDFWMAISRFMDDLEVDLVQNHNMALVDLFGRQHAERVLTAFGRAFGALPQDSADATPGQQAFLKEAVGELAEDGKVVCIRLALFADMLKERQWTLATMKEVGGAEGLGVRFLEEAFSAKTAAPQNRLHQRAARAVLKTLLPAQGTSIRGYMRSREELLQASGYAGRPRDFSRLLHILDSELRLITPTDPDGLDIDEKSVSTAPGEEEYFQLTHDYLVPALRQWLAGKQKETRRGRAELRLAERAEIWNARPENRHLPSLWEWCTIQTFVGKRNRTQLQQEMMRKANRYYTFGGLFLAVVLTIVFISGRELYGRLRAESLVQRILDAKTDEVPAIVAEITPYRRWATPMLRSAYDRAGSAGDAEDVDQQLNISLALLPGDETQALFLRERLLDLEPAELRVVKGSLRLHANEVLATLWDVLEDDRESATRRFNAACAVAGDTSKDDARWNSVRQFVAEQMMTRLSRSPRDFDVLTGLLEPVATVLSESLGELVLDDKHTEPERETALNIFMEYAADQPEVVVNVLMATRNAPTFARLFPLIEDAAAQATPVLESELQKPLDAALEELQKERLGSRQAQAAILLLRLEHPQNVWSILTNDPDPRAAAHFIHRVARYDTVPHLLLDRVDLTAREDEEVSIQRALLQCLGEFSEHQLRPADRNALIRQLLTTYREHSDAGLHGTSGWLLRRWGHEAEVNATDEQLQESEAELRSRGKEDRRRWYVNQQGLTFVIIEGGEFQMGSPESEPGHEDDEIMHTRHVDRTFAIGATEVTRCQFQSFLREQYGLAAAEEYGSEVSRFSLGENASAVRVSWYMAAEYCNWLSAREGIPQDEWCYKPNAAGEYDVGMETKADVLELTGYRLPTEGEWEYACRAGVVTRRYFGTSNELIPGYVRRSRVAEPVGERKPNRIGLFDMYGNAMEWCQNREEGYVPGDAGIAVPDRVASGPVEKDTRRVSRGGCVYSPPNALRSADRNFHHRPVDRGVGNGFRVARTFP